MLTTLCLVSPASPFLKVTLPGAAPSLRFEVTEQTTIVRIALAIECVVLDDHVRMAVSRSRARRLPELDPEYVPLRDYQVPSSIPRCLARRATASSSSTSTASEYTSLSWFNNFLASCRRRNCSSANEKTRLRGISNSSARASALSNRDSSIDRAVFMVAILAHLLVLPTV